MKTCAVGELPWRLSSIMCIIISNYGEYAAAQFWYEFIEELRFRWEKCLKLLGLVTFNFLIRDLMNLCLRVCTYNIEKPFLEKFHIIVKCDMLH